MLSRRHPRWHRNSLAPRRPGSRYCAEHRSPGTDHVPVTPLECAVPRSRALTPLECAVTKTRPRKSFRMRSSEKKWGGGAPTLAKAKSHCVSVLETLDVLVCPRHFPIPLTFLLQSNLNRFFRERRHDRVSGPVRMKAVFAQIFFEQ